MARLLLLYVKDNDAAEAITKLILQSDDVHKEGWGDHVAELGTLISAYSKIEWIIARPLAWCTCTMPGKNRQWGWSNTKRFGWFVHSECNKSARFVVEKFTSGLRGTNNDLLPEYRAMLLAEQLPVEEKVEPAS
jgi:hypothetical protein